MGVVVRRYIDFLILFIPTPLVLALFCNSIPTFSFKNVFSFYHRSNHTQILLPFSLQFHFFRSYLEGNLQAT